MTVIHYGEEYDIQTQNPDQSNQPQMSDRINQGQNSVKKLRDEIQAQKSEQENQVPKPVTQKFAIPPAPPKQEPKIPTQLVNYIIATKLKSHGLLNKY